MRKILLLFAIALLTAALSGCGSTGKSTIDYAYGAEPETLDPRKVMENQSGVLALQTFEGLTVLNEKSEAVPAGAESWKFTPDAMSCTFHLRKTAKWSNGEPVTAHDYEYAWKTALDPKFASQGASMFYFLKNGEQYNKSQNGKTMADVGVTAVDDYTLRVDLAYPLAYLPPMLACTIYSPVNKAIVSATPNWTADVKTYVSNGPFRMEAFEHQNKIVLVPNEHYWDRAAVKAPKLILMIADNNTTRLRMFDNGQADITDNPPAAEIERLLKAGYAKILPHNYTMTYEFNTTKAPFNDSRLRRAFALAIDRNTIVEKVLRGGQKPAGGWVPFGMPDAKPGTDFRVVGGTLIKDNDVAKAKRLLAEAGFPDGKGLPEIQVLYNNDEIQKAVVEALQEMWKRNLNVKIKLQNQEWKVFLQTKRSLNYMIGRGGWGGDYPDPNTYLDVFTSTISNSAGYSDPQFNALVKSANAEINPEKRFAGLHAAEKKLLDDMPMIPIYFGTYVYVSKPEVRGVRLNALKYMYFKEAYIE